MALRACWMHSVITGRPARRAAMPVLFLLSGPKIGFWPQGRHVFPIKVKFGMDERTGGADRTRAKFHIYRGRNVGIQPPKLSKFRILAINLPLTRDSFALFLRNSQRLYASIGSFWGFSLVAFGGHTTKSSRFSFLFIFGDFGGCKATFLKPQCWKLAWLWEPGRPSATLNFAKIA